MIESFAAGEGATLDIIGSSDSAYVDSLHQALVTWNKLRKTKPASGKEATGEPDLPWISFKEKYPPKELAAVTDGFYVGQFSAFLRSRMGFFSVRLSKLIPREVVFLGDAVPHLAKTTEPGRRWQSFQAKHPRLKGLGP